jgi:uncharacterized protein (TIGR00251 family)
VLQITEVISMPARAAHGVESPWRIGGTTERRGRTMETDGLEIRQTEEGCVMRIRVKPGARADSVVGLHGGALKIAVTARPERGRANDAVVSAIAELLGLPRTSVVIDSGHTSRNKTVRIEGVSAGAVRAILAGDHRRLRS